MKTPEPIVLPTTSATHIQNPSIWGRGAGFTGVLLTLARSYMKNPHVKTELPGPRARELIARDALVVSPSYPRDYPFVMAHGRGAEVWDVDGNRFIDFAAGIAVCSTGHSHPAVVAAINEAASRFLHISSDYWHEGQVKLAE